MTEATKGQAMDTTDYVRIEFSMSAIRGEDYTAVATALRAIRDKYARGGSTIEVSAVTEGTVIVRDL